MSVSPAEDRLIDEIVSIERERKAAPDHRKNEFIQRKIEVLRALVDLPGISKANKDKYDGLIAKYLDVITPVVHVIQHPGLVLYPHHGVHYIGHRVLPPGVYLHPSGYVLHG
jgi:hypothetical protein